MPLPDQPLPHLPKPLPRAVLEDMLQVRTGSAALQAQRDTLEEYILKVQGWIDTLKLAIEQNQADFHARRPSWSYDDRVQVETRVKAVTRQRQALQMRFGEVNCQLRRALSTTTQAHAEHLFAIAFVKAALELLDQDTYAMLAELAAHDIQPTAS